LLKTTDCGACTVTVTVAGITEETPAASTALYLKV
jgi:hypothetical protein